MCCVAWVSERRCLQGIGDGLAWTVAAEDARWKQQKREHFAAITDAQDDGLCVCACRSQQRCSVHDVSVEGKTRECREKHISTWAREASSWFENHRDQGTDRGRIETFC